MARHGKIARLPESIRDELNRRLADGHTARQILPWLHALPEVQSLLASHFSGRPISHSNLTHWRQGGYRDWLAARQDDTLLRRATDQPLSASPQDLSRLHHAVLTLGLARVLQSLRDTAPSSDPAHLCRALQSLAALRRAETDAARLDAAIRRFQALDQTRAQRDQSRQNFVRELAALTKVTSLP